MGDKIFELREERGAMLQGCWRESHDAEISDQLDNGLCWAEVLGRELSWGQGTME